MITLVQSPLALLEILVLVLGPMAETQMDQTMHKVPFKMSLWTLIQFY